MGTWGVYNLDSDGARDHLDSIIEQLVETIEGCFAAEAVANLSLDVGNSVLLPTIDVLVLLCEHYKASPSVDPTQVAAWRTTFLEIYDASIEEYGAKPTYRVKRREVIDYTFMKLEKLAHIYA